MANLQTATFGMGCFWCTESMFENVKGVKSVVSGYAGGDMDEPTYKDVSTGTTGHAEVSQITFDPDEISYEELLEIFWIMHDPTQLNRQGNDMGPQYRSIILYHDEEQKKLAEKTKKEIAGKHYDKPVVTQIKSFTQFFEAEEDHQDFYNKNPQDAYCQLVIDPKLAKLREKFQSKLK